MIRYADGTEARVGDQIDMDGQPAIVEAVIDWADIEQGLTGVDEPGLMLRMDFTLYVPDDQGAFVERTFLNDRVFESADSSSWDAVIFLRRADAVPLV